MKLAARKTRMSNALCKVSDVPVNGLKQCETAGGEKVCVVNAGDRFFVCQAYCPHEGIALCEGVFDGETLTCLEHLWQWNLRDDGAVKALGDTSLKMYDVEVIGDNVCLEHQ
jgi:toluene monooxygenase system ferredoxin subunit